MNSHDVNGASPEGILGVAPGADAGEVRRAYLEKIKQFSPESDPAMFQRVRQAYEVLSDPRARVQALLDSEHPFSPLTRQLERAGDTRRRVPMTAWIDVTRE